MGSQDLSPPEQLHSGLICTTFCLSAREIELCEESHSGHPVVKVDEARVLIKDNDTVTWTRTT